MPLSFISTVVIIGFDRVEYNIAEDGGFVELTVRILAGRLGKEATVQFNTVDGNAFCKTVRRCSSVVVASNLLSYVPPQLVRIMLQ